MFDIPFALSQQSTARTVRAKKQIAQMKIYTPRGTNQMLDRIALIISIIGSLNWGAIGIFKFDVVAWLFGGQDSLFSRLVYSVVALAGLWCISLLFRKREEIVDERARE